MIGSATARTTRLDINLVMTAVSYVREAPRRSGTHAVPALAMVVALARH
jgi:hypothetical protein